jgi:3-demethylubiquinone-9 3-methyltransferase (EC 2.1.1.64)
MEMLEHVPDPAAIVSACARLVRPGGAVLFSTLNRNPKSFALAIVGAEYLLGLLPRGTHDYARFIRPSELADWARAADLRPRDATGLQYLPMVRSARLANGDLDVNYLMHCERPA